MLRRPEVIENGSIKRGPFLERNRRRKKGTALHDDALLFVADGAI